MRHVRGRRHADWRTVVAVAACGEAAGRGDAINTIPPFSNAPLWRRKVTRESPVNVAARDPPTPEALVFTNRR